jgi:replicative DNA helicase
MTVPQARIPPHNLDAERAVLGAILLEAAGLERATRRLRPEDFYLEAHRTIFRRLLALAEADVGIDVITLSDALRQAGELEQAGGPATLALLIEHAAVATHLDAYMQIVLREWGKREEASLLLTSIEQAYNGTAPAQLAGELSAALARIADRAEPEVAALVDMRPSRPVPVGEVLEGVVASLGERETDYVPSPIQELNERLGGGLQRQEVVTIGGRPGTAKTALGLQWAVLAADYGHRTLVVSREMSNRALGRRILAQQAQVSASALRRRDVDEAQLIRLRRALPRLGRLPLWLDEQSSTLAQIRRLVRMHRYRFVVVDYLQLVKSPPDAKNRRLEVTAVSAGLKDIAKKYDCSVLALSALRRLQVERGKRAAPALEDLKESGDIEADSDVVLLLHQPKPDSSDRELVFAKLREGEAGGSVTLAFTPVYVRFTEVPAALPVGREPGEEEVPF